MYIISKSEFIRNLIKREHKLSCEVAAIRPAVIEGENSTEPKAFDLVTFNERMQRSNV